MLGIAHGDQTSAVVAVLDELGAVPEVRRLARQDVAQRVVRERRLAARRMAHPDTPVAHVVLAHRHVGVGVQDLDKAADAVVGELCHYLLGAVVLDALQRVAAARHVSFGLVVQGVGDMGHQSVVLHPVRCVCLGAVRVDDPDGTVEHVVLGYCGINRVDGGDEVVHRVGVNCRVVGRHRAAEGVVNHATARHHNPVSRRCGADGRRQQQQRQQHIADNSLLLHNNDHFNGLIIDCGCMTPYGFRLHDRIHPQR